MATHKIRIAAGLALAVGATCLAPTFAASSDTWDRLAQCESGGRWNANTGNGYYGGLQFSAGTWRAYGGTEFAEKAHQATRAEQIAVAERLLAARGWTPWPSCSAKLQLTADAVLAAAERKAANTAARAASKQAAFDALTAKVDRAVRNAGTAPIEQQAARLTKIARLQTLVDEAAAVAADAKADADRAARKLRAARAAAGVTH